MPQTQRQAMASFHSVMFGGSCLTVLCEGKMLSQEEQARCEQVFHFLV
jgi:hypothetical protein